MSRLTPQDQTGNAAADEPSRAELKRRMDRLQDLGKKLIELPAGKLARMDLPEKLHAAVTEARRLTAMGAIRRQLQYIGRIMEEFDTPAIARSLRDIDHSKAKPPQDDTVLDHARLIIAGGNDVLFSLCGSTLDATAMQQLRQALRQATKNIAAGKNSTQEESVFAEKLAQFTSSLPVH